MQTAIRVSSQSQSWKHWQVYRQRRQSWDEGALPNEQDRALELLARHKGRASFIDFAQYVDDLYVADPFHEALGRAFDDVVAGKIRKLIINAPPQHGKSRATSEILPAYWLGKRPNDPVIIASYGAELAEAKSRAARSIVDSEYYVNLFGQRGALEVPAVDISPTSSAVYQWRLDEPYRGGVRAAGVEGPLTGFPGKLGIIDDPVKDMKEGQSKTIREGVWDWYRSVFRTRMNKGSAIIIIMTRWHPEDLVGKILAEAQENEWMVLRFPALAETQEVRDANNIFLGLPVGLPDPIGRAPGEPLAPNRFDTEDLLDFKREAGPHIWGAAYDNVPKQRQGNMFQSEWFQLIDPKDVPRVGKRVRYWDKAGSKAATTGTPGAASAGVLILKAGDKFYIEHVVRGWWRAAEREAMILKQAQLDAAKYGKHNFETWIEQEPGSGGKESAESTEMNLSKQGFSIKKDRPSGDKDTRLDPLATQAENLNVFMVVGEWNTDYIDEMIAIPNAVRRDQGDASSGAFNILTLSKKSTDRSDVTGLPGRGQKRAPLPRR